MVANYPYFGLPNYMRYMNPSAYKNIQQQKQEYIRNNSRAQPQNRNPYYSTPYTQNNRQNSQAPMNSRNNLNYRPSSYPKKKKLNNKSRLHYSAFSELIYILMMYLFCVFCSFYIMKK